MEELARFLGECLRKLLDDGFELPLCFAAISVNGVLLAGKYKPAPDGTLECEPLADPAVAAQPMQLPINIMFTDARGEAARLVIETHENTQSLISLG